MFEPAAVDQLKMIKPVHPSGTYSLSITKCVSRDYIRLHGIRKFTKLLRVRSFAFSTVLLSSTYVYLYYV